MLLGQLDKSFGTRLFDTDAPVWRYGAVCCSVLTVLTCVLLHPVRWPCPGRAVPGGARQRGRGGVRGGGASVVVASAGTRARARRAST